MKNLETWWILQRTQWPSSSSRSQEELSNMVEEAQRGKQSCGHKTTDVTDDLNDAALTEPTAKLLFRDIAPPVELLMNCVVAIASNERLIEKFRCELPNIISLTSEEYPSAGEFIRDYSSRALMSVPERNFNAGLAWYLLDCNVVTKMVERMTNYTLATTITLDTVERALSVYESLTSNRSIPSGSATGIDGAAAAAAVSEALGLTQDTSDHEEMLTPKSPLTLSGSHESKYDRGPDPPSSSEIFCLASYDVRIGLKSLIYVLERTFRFTLVLMEAFQTSGGYALLLRLLDTCTEEEIPTLLDMVTLLMPLGSRSSDICDSIERATGGTIFGARNVHAFSIMRDLLLSYIVDLNIDRGIATELTTEAQRRNEHLILQLLTHVLHIYTSDYDNFVILEPKTRTLALLLTKLPYTIFYDAQVIILRIVEYVCCAAKSDDPLPHEILSVVCGLLIAYDPISFQARSQKNGVFTNTQFADRDDLASKGLAPDALLGAFEEGPISTLSTLMCECLIKILRNSETDRYKQELSAFGLMDRGVYLWLNQIAGCLVTVPESDMPTRHNILAALKAHLDLYGNLMCLMLRHNTLECVRFRQARAHQALYAITDVLVSSDVLTTPFDLVQEDIFHLNGFSIIHTLTELVAILRYTSSHENDHLVILQAGVESDLSGLLELLQRFRGAIWRQMLLLHILMELLKEGGSVIAPLWKVCQGYEILVALLSSLDMTDTESSERSFQMMDLVLEVLGVTLHSQHGGADNAEYFGSIHGYSTVASCIITSGVVQSSKREAILQRVFELISGGSTQSEIQNGDACRIVFRLLPTLPENVAIVSMKKLLSMFECVGGATVISKRERAIRLVQAGVFKWMNDPDIIQKIRETQDPLNPFLLKWISTIALEEDISIPRLHDVLGIVGKGIPRLLSNGRLSDNPTEEVLESITPNEPEAGLLLLRNLSKSPSIRHISVGKPQGTEQTGRYVHIVNSADRVWPPASGYSFSCWLCFPALPVCNTTQAKSETFNNKAPSINSTASVPLCEGYLVLVPDDNHEERMDAYGVLVGTTLALFASNELAARNEVAMEELDVSQAIRKGPLEWSFVSDARVFLASCTDEDKTEIWWRAMEQCTTSTDGTADSSVRTYGLASNDDLLTSFGVKRDGDISMTILLEESHHATDEGSACIVSIYSLESSGCFIRAFFEQSTGFLRFHTGAVSSGPSINANSKRTSVVFETVAIDDLRSAIAPSGRRPAGDSATTTDAGFSLPEHTEKKRDWHHVAFTHRKSVVGSSLVTVYIDGLEIGAKKLNYPSAPSTGCFQAFMGSDAQVCSPHSALSWKAGPSWFIDEVISSSNIAGMFSLGPTYSHLVSGHSYRSVGDWLEAMASSHLARAADRGIEIAQFAQRLQLTKLGRSCKRQWKDRNDPNTTPSVTQNTANDAVAAGAALIAESMIAKREELAEGLRLATGAGGAFSRKERNKVAAFRDFVGYDCAMSSFGSEIESLLQTCKISEDAVLFTLNTSSSDRSNTPVLTHTQIHYINCTEANGLDLARSLPSLGGISQILFPLLDNATQQRDFYMVFKMLIKVLRRNPTCLAECIGFNGYTFITALLCSRVDLIDEKVLTCVVRLAVAGKLVAYATSSAGMQLAHPVVVDFVALSQVVLNAELRKKLPHHLQCQLVSLLMDLMVTTNPNALFNARQLRRAGLFQWIITYLTELGNEECRMDTYTALEMRWCFPKFSEPTFEAILQYALSLLRAFLRIESHVDDWNGIGEIMLLSMTNTILHTRESSIRMILLQFILHEIENDASHSEGASTLGDSGKARGETVQRLSGTIVEAIMYREGDHPLNKKRDDKRVEMSGNSLETAALGSPLADSSSRFGKGLSAPYPIDGFANILLEVINQAPEDGPWVSPEVILAIRIVLSLAQCHTNFAEHLLCQSILMQKLKRVLQKYSADGCVYIPLLAYVSNILIGDTSYYDPDTLTATELGPKPFSSPVAPTDIVRGIDQVWDLIGDLLLHNCRQGSSGVGTEVTVIVLEKIACRVESILSFFPVVCRSSATVFRIVAECLLSGSEDIGKDPSLSAAAASETLSSMLQGLAERLEGETSTAVSITDACVNLIQVIMTRSLSGDEFGSLMMLFLEVLDESILKQGGLVESRIAGQKCWLALLKHVIKREKTLVSNITVASLKNICTVCVALARYLGDEDNHHLGQAMKDSPASNSLEFDAIVASTIATEHRNTGPNGTICIGVDVIMFLLNCCDQCSNPAITEALGMEGQRFFYGSLIYSAQTAVLNELNCVHQDMRTVQRILDCLVESKHVLFQRPSWQSIVVCGIVAQNTANETSGGFDPNSVSSGRRPRRLHRGRSLSANAHKEFGIGSESDRCFILALVSHLYRMLMNDSTKVRHTAIVVWQFLIDQRFDVLKELLISEPRTSVLHTITSTKKEAAVDIFHGGFDRLLYALHSPDGDDGVGNTVFLVNQEIWCQFQLWLAENNTLVEDLLVVRTESIHRHMLDVLLSCVCLRKGSGTELSLNTNFPVRFDIRKETTRSDIYDELDSDRREIVARKAVIKYTSIRDSALESLNDGLSQWREMSVRLAYTRNIWQTGKWQLSTPEPADIAPNRSLFQRKLLGYSLDPTEGPHRMRLRLMRDYTYEDRVFAARTEARDIRPDADEYPTMPDSSLRPSSPPRLNPVEHLDNQPFRRSMEFHDAVKVFREFVYQQSTTGHNTEGTAPMLQNILTRCEMDSTRQLLQSLEGGTEGHGAITIYMVAKAIHYSFFEDPENSDGKSAMGVSPSIIADIQRLIKEAGEDLDTYVIPPTLFDAADAEATQYALYAVRNESTQAISLDTMKVVDDTGEEDRFGSDDDFDDVIPVESALPVDGEESDESDGHDEVKESGETEGASLPRPIEDTTKNDSVVSERDTRDPADISTFEPTSSNADQNKRIDTSSDAVYGAVARFLRRDDYPPMQSFNGAFIAGMGRTPGIFMICRFGMYFIGGYTKLYNNLDSQDESLTPRPTPDMNSIENVPSQASSQSGNSTTGGTPTGTRGRKKNTKKLIQAALTDFSMQFASSKGGSDQVFTVVPLPDLTAQPGSPSSGTSMQCASARTSRWSIKYSNVKQFCRIKYQLRPVGIEFFDTFGSTYFLQLETSADREEVVKLLFQMPLVNSIFWSPVLRTGALVPSIKRIRQAVTKRWLRGSMTNFEYLMHLNTLAGRSFNDITQYPVFPWVIADYTSEFLDLGASDSYRDLSKPMGAIGENRAANFRERYAAMNQDMDFDGPMETPAFHYGTHYSCSAYVVNYLIRLEPFTALALELQGGVFDHPDRLFRSIPSSWTSASRDNLQDVRELIPEFFYLPEFLYNANKCEFGTTQSGEEVWHVLLPPWAHGDPREFVRLNRQALESKYVSEHLHEWIDLIFGVKQTGQAAVDSQNVFMHFTYEGTVDIEQITDPVMQAATLAQIENFGQTPSRLFLTPHPQRRIPTLVPTALTSGSPTDAVPLSTNPFPGHQYDGMTLSAIETYVKWHTPLAPALVAIGKDYVFLKKHTVVSVQVNGGAIGDVKLVHDKIQCQSVGCTFMPPRFAKYLDWGNNSGVMKLRVHQQSSGAGRYRDANKVLAIAEGAHYGSISCASVSDDGALLVTGGQDAVVNLIECSKTADGRRVFNQSSKFVGHSDAVVCVAINKEFNLIASSSADRSVLLWDLRTRALLQELAGHSATVSHVSINSANGNVLTTTSSEIRLWSINGDLLAASTSSAFGLQAISCAISTRCDSWQCGVIAVTGHMNGAIALWGIRYPDDFARQKKDEPDSVVEAGSACSSQSSSKRVDATNMPASIQSPSRGRTQVVLSCQLFILKLLLDHRAKVTALTLGPEQRQLLSGDVDGNCIRWVDDSISTNIHL
ncbi:hypothetical protein V7S43_009236 [Phytophthora oleae]|uniref:BEACH domain-containing protein n=1 Tax=Phytophthora oleae TaxID=2107226 RepID=A0ABD3FLC2_9STRA